MALQRFRRSRDDGKDPFLVGARRDGAPALRARRGMTRRALAAEAGVSERHLANLESGVGNASILVLRQVARALDCPLAELVGDAPSGSPEWLHDPRTAARTAASAICTARASRWRGCSARLRRAETRSTRIALIGLRGAGKSTLGRHARRRARLSVRRAEPRDRAPRRLQRRARSTRCTAPSAYRRYERRALDDVVQPPPEAVIATPGGIVVRGGDVQPAARQCTRCGCRRRPTST